MCPCDRKHAHSSVSDHTGSQNEEHYCFEKVDVCLLNNLLNGITKIFLQKMGYYSSEVQALGSSQQINILVVI